MPTAQFLTLTSDELLQRYADEKPLQIKTDTFKWVIPHVCLFDNSIQRFPLDALQEQFDRSKPEYTIPALLELQAKDVLEKLGSEYYNSSTIRLNGIVQSGESLTLITSKAHYFDYLATNYAMDAPVPEQRKATTLRDLVHPDKKLCQLDTSLLANHIGVGALVFTSDNYLILPIRSSNKVATLGQQRMSPSISGTSSYDEDRFTSTIAPVAALMREGKEELGLEESDYESGSEVFLGITRELLRGGKPEFFFALRLSITRTQVEQKFHAASDRWENENLSWFEFSSSTFPPTTTRERSVFLNQFLNLIHQYQNQFSYPLQANCALWFQYMLS